MVERVAVALFLAMWPREATEELWAEWDEDSPERLVLYRRLARVAIEAMREPTPGTHQAADKAVEPIATAALND